MRHLLSLPLLCLALTAAAQPDGRQRVAANDDGILYVGRRGATSAGHVSFNWPGLRVRATFGGSSVAVVCKPGSGYWMASVDGCAPFKVSFDGAADSVAQVATALNPDATHRLDLLYCIEGYEKNPELRGLLLDAGAGLGAAPKASQRRIEVVGNSITCGYGVESCDPTEHFSYATENHYYSYIQRAARQLGADCQVVARSGIGVYRNYGGPKSGTPLKPLGTPGYEPTMTQNYQQTRYNGPDKWDFGLFRPDVVVVNLGTNDLSTHSYDERLFAEGHRALYRQIRERNPQAKIVLLTGSMLSGEELLVARRTLDRLRDEARKDGDDNVFRLDLTPQDGQLLTGADYHPSFYQQEKMGAELASYLRALMKWF